MCEFKSAILIKSHGSDSVELFHVDGVDSHSELVKRRGFNDNDKEVRIAKVELVPDLSNEPWRVETWKWRLDEYRRPDWLDEITESDKEHELRELCRALYIRSGIIEKQDFTTCFGIDVDIRCDIRCEAGWVQAFYDNSANSGEIAVSGGDQLFCGSSTNSGEITVSGGYQRFHGNSTNSGEIAVSGGDQWFYDNSANSGEITVSGGVQLFYGNSTNSGEIVRGGAE